MNPLPALSRREREVMDLVYELGNATAAQIRENMADPPTYSAVRSTLRILVEKGHMVSERDGPRYVYSPTMPALRARRSAMRHVLRTFFGGSVAGAVATLLEVRGGELTPEEHDRIAEMIEQAASRQRFDTEDDRRQPPAGHGLEQRGSHDREDGRRHVPLHADARQRRDEGRRHRGQGRRCRQLASPRVP